MAQTRGPGRKKRMSETVVYNIKSLTDQGKARVIRWTRDKLYWYLEIGTRPIKGNPDEFTLERSIPIHLEEIIWIDPPEIAKEEYRKRRQGKK